MVFPEILHSEDIQQNLRNLLADSSYDSTACLCDSNTAEYCYPLLRSGFPLIVIPAGEINKTLQTAELVLSEMLKYKLSRKSLLINLGGGTVSDIGGFCASVYQRGIDYINIPTTLLAMADAGIGGKTGVDFQNLKNYIGTFHQPAAVIIDTVFLKTLPKAEYMSGWAEVIKHLLLFDSKAWEAFCRLPLPSYPPADTIRDTINRASQLKHDIVQKDPYDKAERKLLNFGHTIGHAIETCLLSQGRPILHGEAVAAGLVCEAWISQQLAGLDEETFVDIRNVVYSMFGKLSLQPEELQAIAALTSADKKNEGGEVRMVLLRRTAEAAYNIPVPQSVIHDSLTQYLNHET